MTPSTGPISASHVRTELGRSQSSSLSINDPAVRSLAGVAPGASISMSQLRGKGSNPYTPMSITPTNGGEYRNTSTGGGTISSTAYVTVAGGSGAKTYLWTQTNRTGIAGTVGALNGASLTVQYNYGLNSNGFFDYTFSCTVTDGTGASVTATDIHVYADWSGNA